MKYKKDIEEQWKKISDQSTKSLQEISIATVS
jgi:hypothetical protein